jgi:PAS domain S-box-containing protein
VTDAAEKTFRPFLSRGILLFLAFSLGVGAAGFWYYGVQKKLRLADYGRQLSAISDLKIQQIQNWRRERLGDVLTASRNPGLFSMLKSLQQRPKPEISSRGFRDWLETYRQAFGYRDVSIFNGQGEIVFRIGTDAAGKVRAGLQRAVSDALQTGASSLTDIDFSDGPDQADLEVVAPVIDPETKGLPVGVIVFHISPNDFLFPLIQAWPTPSDSAETLLVRRQGENVLYLNELRHRKNTAGRLRFPLTKSDLPAASAALGQFGLMEGRDYREVATLADRKAVPESPWFLVAKVDLAEIFLPLRFEGRILLLLCLALIVAAGTATGYLIRREQVRHLRMERNEHRERLAAESARAESEDKFRHIFEYSVIGKSITLPSGEIQVNKAFSDMLGYSRDELIAKRWQDISHPEEIAVTQRFVDALTRGEKEFARFQKRYLHKSGAVVWADVATSIRRDAAGRPLYFMTTVMDITEQKQAESELKALSERNKALLAAVPDIIMEVDGEKRYTWANDAGRDFFGADVVGREAAEYFVGAQKTYDLVRPLFEGSRKDVVYVESWQRRKDGQARLLAWWCRALTDDEGRVTGVLSSAQDFTEHREAENEIRKLNEELEQRVAERTAQLEEANRELETFSYSVSHDLRAPLRIVDGFSQALLEDYKDLIDEEGRDHLDRIRANAQFMGCLIDDMLKLARVSKTETAIEDVDLSGLARQSAADIARAYPGRAVDLSIAAGLTGRGDPRLLRIVFDNLFDNAWKFTSRTPLPRVEFGAVEAEGEPAYCVRDNGVGFDMKYAGKLFGAFQRLHAREEFPGTGIGLATVQRIVHRLGGRVWAEGREGRGAVFFFTLNEPERRIV